MRDQDLASPGDGVYGLARKECRAAQRALAGRKHPHDSIHAARKAIRRLRSVLSLAAGRFDQIEAADRVLRRLGRGLSRLRDAYVITATARQLSAEGSAAAWAPAIECLQQRCERMLGNALASDEGFARRRLSLRRAVDRLASLPWDTLTAHDIDKRIRRSAKRVLKAQERARTDDDPETVHAWRRSTRRLRMQLEASRTLRLDCSGSKSHKQARLASARRIKGFRTLADRLGRYQDLQVLSRVLTRLQVLRDHPAVKVQLQQAMAEATP